MRSEILLPDSEVIRRHVLTSLSRYWRKEALSVSRLPIRIVATPSANICCPLVLKAIRLPQWAADCGVNGELLIPCEACPPEPLAAATAWQAVDWYFAAFLFLEAWHERLWEQKHAPIHSYSSRLRGWDERIWQHAWVNRIALFMRRWAAQEAHADADTLFGPLPAAEILLTHDVDATRKTLALRLKQGAFCLFNAVRALRQGSWRDGGVRIRQMLRFLLGKEEGWQPAQLLRLEQAYGIKSLFYFYADSRRKTPQRWLFDPDYDVASPTMDNFIGQVLEAGHRIGLHPSFTTWQHGAELASQRRYLEKAAGLPIACCRQHWLRFAWQATWTAQEDAGINFDTTLMFNDRPGFRNASAITWHPWSTASFQPHALQAQPTILMDSHLYDYQTMSSEQRRLEIRAWLNECRAVHGQAALLWHPHTLTEDYGWAAGFKDLLTALSENRS